MSEFRPCPPPRPNQLEKAFRFADPRRPPTCYNPNEKRHIWSFREARATARPSMHPLPAPAPTPPTPPPPPHVVRGDDNRSLKWHSGDFYEGDLTPAAGCLQESHICCHWRLFVDSFESGLRHGVGAYHYGASGVVTVSQFSRDRLVGVGLRWSGDRRRRGRVRRQDRAAELSRRAARPK